MGNINMVTENSQRKKKERERKHTYAAIHTHTYGILHSFEAYSEKWENIKVEKL